MFVSAGVEKIGEGEAGIRDQIGVWGQMAELKHGQGEVGGGLEKRSVTRQMVELRHGQGEVGVDWRGEVRGPGVGARD